MNIWSDCTLAFPQLLHVNTCMCSIACVQLVNSLVTERLHACSWLFISYLYFFQICNSNVQKIHAINLQVSYKQTACLVFSLVFLCDFPESLKRSHTCLICEFKLMVYMFVYKIISRMKCIPLVVGSIQELYLNPVFKNASKGKLLLDCVCSQCDHDLGLPKNTIPRLRDKGLKSRFLYNVIP